MVVRVWIGTIFLVADTITVVDAAILGAQKSQLKPHVERCPGNIPVAGYGQIALVKAKWNKPRDPAADVQVKAQNEIIAYMKSRAYFGDKCTPSNDDTTYAGLHLIGKTLRYTVDLSGAGCGCNAALSISPLRRSTQLTKCDDYFCDANKVCGVNCAEIDIQEANRYTFLTTLHTQNDRDGTGKGKSSQHRDWTADQYGPNASCINTLEPFSVSAAFPANQDNATIKGIVISLQQNGRQCSSLETGISSHCPSGYKCPLSVMLKEGVTPIVSYWGVGEDLGWFDSPDGRSREGKRCDARRCADSVRFYNFAIEDLPKDTENALLERTRVGPVVALREDEEKQDVTDKLSYNEEPHSELISERDSTNNLRGGLQVHCLLMMLACLRLSIF